MSSSPGSRAAPPAVDTRLVAPESRYEIEDGKVVLVSPADEPHASRHSKVSAVVEAHVAADYDVASDMLTRLTEIDDAAPDVSIFPIERDPATGGRRIEEMAFEVVSTERLVDAGRKAKKLMDRGVRRVLAVDVERRRVLEWSRELAGWSILPDSGTIDDRALAVPLPIDALVRAAKSDDAVARALLAKHNPVLREALDRGAELGRSAGKTEGKLEGKIEALLLILSSRGIVPDAEEDVRIRQGGALVDRWLTCAATCATVGELLDSAR